MKKLSKKNILIWRKEKTLNKCYKIIKNPLSKKFEEKFFSYKIREIDKKLLSYDIIKTAEALRDCKGMFIKEPKSPTWLKLYTDAMTIFRYYIKTIDEIDDEKAINKLLAVISGKTIKEIEYQKKRLKN